MKMGIGHQEEYKRLCGRSYCKDYLDYICVDPIGERISPNYITAAFPQLLVKNGLRRIRFHDLRHPYVKHTTKNISLQKQKSQTTNGFDSLRFLFSLICLE